MIHNEYDIEVRNKKTGIPKGCQPRPEQRATLFRINWQLHKQGKHACAVCLKVFDWTHDNFQWKKQSKGYLDAVCTTCRQAVKRPSRTWGEQKRTALTRALRQV